MRVLPFDKTAVIYVLLMILIPIAPLILTMIPLNEILAKLLQIIF